MSKAKRALAIVAITSLAVASVQPASAAKPSPSMSTAVAGCDEVPTGVQASDYFLNFTVPPDLMPDPQFTGQEARLQVHRVQPVYAHGKCLSVPNRAAVLIHGRTVFGPATFDLRHPAPRGGDLSVQKALARAGIDTFVPNLLGYGRSTGFGVLDDPGNASLPGFSNGTCGFPQGCDRTHVPVFPLDQQGGPLFVNPLERQRRPHSNGIRFARVDVFVRDIRQVIDDAILKAQPSDGKVTLLGLSVGAQHVARTLYANNPVLDGSDEYIAKVNRVVFLSSFFGTPTEETPPPTGFATFPLHVFNAAGVASAWEMPNDRGQACTGHVVSGSPQQVWTQVLQDETVGLEWGGTRLSRPTGLARSPVFSSYGWNPSVAAQLTTPTLVIHGLEDMAAPAANASTIYVNLQMTNKVLVQVACASHALLWEGCLGRRCSGNMPYGGKPGIPWAGPYSTLKAALIEWITSGTFDGESNGRFIIDESGVAIGPLTP